MNTRDTCDGPIHDNFVFLISSLNEVNVSSENSSHQFIKNNCFEKIMPNCFTRNCLYCEHKKTIINRIQNADDDIAYKNWITVTETHKNVVVENRKTK